MSHQSKKTLLLQSKAISPNADEDTISNIEIGSISNRYCDNHPISINRGSVRLTKKFYP